MKINNKTLFVNYLILVLFGLMMIYSTTFQTLVELGKLPFLAFLAQLFLIVVLFGVAILIIYQKNFFIRIFNKNINGIYAISSILLLLVLTPLGTDAGGASSIIGIGFITFQPIELFKITLIFYLAKYFSDNPNPSTSGFIMRVFLIPGISIIFILLEPDLGGALIVSLVLFLMIIINGEKLKLTFSIVMSAGLGGIILFFSTGLQYQVQRLFIWLNPFANVAGDGNNLIQSYIAISNGGLAGSGYTHSIQKSGYLFASSTDFIFSIIAEELGIIGVFLIIGLLMFLCWQIYVIGRKFNKKFEYLFCTGFASLILVQTFINIGGVTGIIPMTGVTLPFVSQGTNSFVFLSLGVLYVFIVDTNRKKIKKDRSGK